MKRERALDANLGPSKHSEQICAPINQTESHCQPLGALGTVGSSESRCHSTGYGLCGDVRSPLLTRAHKAVITAYRPNRSTTRISDVSANGLNGSESAVHRPATGRSGNNQVRKGRVFVGFTGLTAPIGPEETGS